MNRLLWIFLAVMYSFSSALSTTSGSGRVRGSRWTMCRAIPSELVLPTMEDAIDANRKTAM